MLEQEVLGMGLGLVFVLWGDLWKYTEGAMRVIHQREEQVLTAGHSWTLHGFPLLPTPPLSHGVFPSLLAIPPTCLPTGNVVWLPAKALHCSRHKEGQRPQQRGSAGSFSGCRKGEVTACLASSPTWAGFFPRSLLSSLMSALIRNRWAQLVGESCMLTRPRLQ